MQQVNTFKDLGTQLDILQKNIDTNRSKHEELVAKLSAVVDHEKTARQARRDADQSVNDSVRKMNKVESEESLLKAQLENHQISKRRFEEEAQNSKRQVELAKKTLGELDDLDAMRKQVDDVKLTVEAARLS